ncbi:hypothetical protein C7M84_000729 [Penaeus vannamei]|uniref:Uncharacterized protein n=1 Tax=Penaeus vannamei TaxID=6689 RepID=A0A423TVR0_PENVA|nr:hypothetical protein C7M84_000729 [Penaeus vannamei]
MSPPPPLALTPSPPFGSHALSLPFLLWFFCPPFSCLVLTPLFPFSILLLSHPLPFPLWLFQYPTPSSFTSHTPSLFPWQRHPPPLRSSPLATPPSSILALTHYPPLHPLFSRLLHSHTSPSLFPWLSHPPLLPFPLALHPQIPLSSLALLTSPLSLSFHSLSLFFLASSTLYFRSSLVSNSPPFPLAFTPPFPSPLALTPSPLSSSLGPLTISSRLSHTALLPRPLCFVIPYYSLIPFPLPSYSPPSFPSLTSPPLLPRLTHTSSPPSLPLSPPPPPLTPSPLVPSLTTSPPPLLLPTPHTLSPPPPLPLPLSPPSSPSPYTLSSPPTLPLPSPSPSPHALTPPPISRDGSVIRRTRDRILGADEKNRPRLRTSGGAGEAGR